MEQKQSPTIQWKIYTLWLCLLSIVQYFQDPACRELSTNTCWMNQWMATCISGWMNKGWMMDFPENRLSPQDSWEYPLGNKEIKLVTPKGNQPWIFFGRTDAEAETPVLWPADVNNWLIGKDPDAGKDWRQEEKWTTEDEMVGWHHWFDGHEFEQAPGVVYGQGSLLCYSSCSCKMSDTTERMNWTDSLELWD